MGGVMNEKEKKSAMRWRCLSCGEPIAAEGWCAECVVDFGMPCAGCEGRSLLDVEEEQQ
jgi:hypothetical protein